ncbi:LuxR C-terminal-related transcriptional regulator [Kitasatospora sp. NPDC002543]
MRDTHGRGPVPADRPDPAVFWRNRALQLLDHMPLPIALCDFGGRILIVNRAMAAEFGRLPGQLRDRRILEFFTLLDSGTLEAVTEAIRLHRRSQYPARVSWTPAGGRERYGRMTVALVGDVPQRPPSLLLSLHATELPDEAERAEASPVEARILAAAARGDTTAQIAREIGVTPDGVNYHLARLSRRWRVPNRTALVARAYATGVLAPNTWPPQPALPV